MALAVLLLAIGVSSIRNGLSDQAIKRRRSEVRDWDWKTKFFYLLRALDYFFPYFLVLRSLLLVIPERSICLVC